MQGGGPHEHLRHSEQPVAQGSGYATSKSALSNHSSGRCAASPRSLAAGSPVLCLLFVRTRMADGRTGKIFAIGGKSPKGACDAVICYDPAGDSWTSSPGLSPLRTLTAQACVGSDIYVFGGTSSDESIVDSIDKFDTNTCTWSSVRVACELAG